MVLAGHLATLREDIEVNRHLGRIKKTENFDGKPNFFVQVAHDDLYRKFNNGYKCGSHKAKANASDFL